MNDKNQDNNVQDAPNHGQGPEHEHINNKLDSKRMEEFSAELTDSELPDFEEEKGFNQVPCMVGGVLFWLLFLSLPGRLFLELPVLYLAL